MDYGVVIVQPDQTASLSSGNNPQFVRGMDLLFQQVVMELASDPLTNRGGSGFVSALRKLPPNTTSAPAIFGRRLKVAQENVLSAQRDYSPPIDEQLQRLDLLSAYTNDDGDGWITEIALSSRAGEEIVRSIA